MKRMLLVISNAEDGIRRLQNYIELGFTEIVLTNSSPNRDNLVKLVAEKIIPLKAKTTIDRVTYYLKSHKSRGKAESR